MYLHSILWQIVTVCINWKITSSWIPSSCLCNEFHRIFRGHHYFGRLLQKGYSTCYVSSFLGLLSLQLRNPVSEFHLIPHCKMEPRDVTIYITPDKEINRERLIDIDSNSFHFIPSEQNSITQGHRGYYPLLLAPMSEHGLTHPHETGLSSRSWYLFFSGSKSM